MYVSILDDCDWDAYLIDPFVNGYFGYAFGLLLRVCYNCK